MPYLPDRGDLVFLDFTPQKGHEQAGQRPAIVLSSEAFNKATHFAIVCPITSHIKGYPFEVILPDDLHIHGAILADQVKSLDWHARNFQFKEKAPESVLNSCLTLIHTILYT
ncbi:mRNA-degrading endonuclease [Sporolactobacillus shoreae]|uniref:mRNA-degrading endonuclease n=1 Tax=Sporolactobacillus shoreae TaxID=1465501 RepID=A0A4Z0GMT7_9BACL|nr:type II toxin-antitoxin system PemK/MazF family toxin [Sporolactobacillus shoreae]TGA97193.1 mRNA-degrading endonuclease [Sporolactobacillus shoreae]